MELTQGEAGGTPENLAGRGDALVPVRKCTASPAQIRKRGETSAARAAAIVGAIGELRIQHALQVRYARLCAEIATAEADRCALEDRAVLNDWAESWIERSRYLLHKPDTRRLSFECLDEAIVAEGEQFLKLFQRYTRDVRRALARIVELYGKADRLNQAHFSPPPRLAQAVAQQCSQEASDAAPILTVVPTETSDYSNCDAREFSGADQSVTPAAEASSARAVSYPAAEPSSDAAHKSSTDVCQLNCEQAEALPSAREEEPVVVLAPTSCEAPVGISWYVNSPDGNSCESRAIVPDVPPQRFYGHYGGSGDSGHPLLLRKAEGETFGPAFDYTVRPPGVGLGMRKPRSDGSAEPPVGIRRRITAFATPIGMTRVPDRMYQPRRWPRYDKKWEMECVWAVVGCSPVALAVPSRRRAFTLSSL